MNGRTLRHAGRMLLVAATVLVASACGSDDDRSGDSDIGVAAISQAMVDRYAADADQADCIASYTAEAYDDEELELILADGITALPQARWDVHLTSVFACLTQPPP